MSTETISRFAAGVYEIAAAEGEAGRVGDELYRIAQSFGSSPDLNAALTDPRLPMERKQAVVSDLLGGRAHDLTVSLVDFIVATGHASDLTEIATQVVEHASEKAGKALAEVRSAIPLDDATTQRLEQALAQAVGRPVEARVVVDSTVLGGLQARIGDTVIDGTVKGQLESLRESLEVS